MCACEIQYNACSKKDMNNYLQMPQIWDFRSPLDLFLFHVRSIKRLSQANSSLNLVGHLLSAIIEVNNAADLQRRTLWGAPMHDIHIRTYVHM